MGSFDLELSKNFNVIITVTEEPLYINPFLGKVIENIHSDIKKIYIIKGSITGKKTISEKIQYLIAISLISNPFAFVKRLYTLVLFNIFIIILADAYRNPFSIAYTAKKFQIPVIFADDVNSESFLMDLKNDNPSIIINQAQVILKEKFLSIPQIGSLNRHCGLLPKYRGRLAPFWAYLMREKESGVSIHFIDNEIDNGPIIIQKKVKIERFDTFDTILKKDFEIAPTAMVEAINLIKNGNYIHFMLPNERGLASYYSSPKIIDALSYRKVMLKKWLLNE